MIQMSRTLTGSTLSLISSRVLRSRWNVRRVGTSRMTRSLMHLLQIVKDFEDKGIELISLRENIDTSTVTGRCFLSIMGTIAQNLIQEP
jgi:hypothetical protein